MKKQKAWLTWGIDSLGFQVTTKSWLKGRGIPLVVQCYTQSEAGTIELILLTHDVWVLIMGSSMPRSSWNILRKIEEN